MATETQGKCIVYVPVIYMGRTSCNSNPEPHGATCGVFSDYNDASDALIRALVNMEILTLPEVMKEGDKYADYYNYDEGYEKYDSLVELLAKKRFIYQLQKEAQGSFQNLHKVCEENGDSYYQEGWDVQINRFVIDEKSQFEWFSISNTWNCTYKQI